MENETTEKRKPEVASNRSGRNIEFRSAVRREETKHTVPSSISALRNIGVAYAIACAVAGLLIIFNSKRPVLNEFPTSQRTQVSEKKEVDLSLVGAGIGIIGQGITVAVFLAVAAGVAENVFHIRRKLEE